MSERRVLQTRPSLRPEGDGALSLAEIQSAQAYSGCRKADTQARPRKRVAADERRRGDEN